MKPLHFVAMLLCALAPVSSQACLWDSDTLATESARFPNVAGIMTGLFPRHSKEFHTWRIQQKQPLVEAGKAVAADYDDLAVSQHKLGDHKAAITTMEAKEKKMPDLYETYSNLGTFYIYAGELSTAQRWIEKALAVNPNAHFGREKYQRWLVMWLRERRSIKRTEAEQEDDLKNFFTTRPFGFAAFVSRQERGDPSQTTKVTPLTESQRQAAIRGVTGMMYFADFDNPILQEALGDLLSLGDMDKNAAQLGSLCYLQAAEKATDPAEKSRLTSLKLRAMTSTPVRDEAKLQRTLETALNQGVKVAKDVRGDELAWIAAGKDVAAEFQKKYLTASN